MDLKMMPIIICHKGRLIGITYKYRSGVITLKTRVFKKVFLLQANQQRRGRKSDFVILSIEISEEVSVVRW